MQNKLLNCPFCGGEAIKVAFSWGAITDEYTIECKMCGTRTKVLKLEDAIKIWNTRKPMERIVEQLEDKMLTSSSASTEAIIGMCGVSATYYNGEYEAYKKAIEIVKGGVDNAG